MKISREVNGQILEFELTSVELSAAYLEQEAINDYGNIKQNMESYLNSKDYERLKNNEAFIEKAASILRENQDDSDVTMLLFDDNVKNIFSRMMVECLDMVYGPEKEIDISDKQPSLADKIQAAEAKSIIPKDSGSLSVKDIINNVVDELQRARERIKELGSFDDRAITPDEELISDIDKSIERLSVLSSFGINHSSEKSPAEPSL